MELFLHLTVQTDGWRLIEQLAIQNNTWNHLTLFKY